MANRVDLQECVGSQSSIPISLTNDEEEDGEVCEPSERITIDLTNTEDELIERNTQTNPWCKLFCETDMPGNERDQPYYFINLLTNVSAWDEPEEEYWLWDYTTGSQHVSGLQKPTDKAQLKKEQEIRDEEKGPLKYDEVTPDPRNAWQGYDPKVHGSYDTKAPYTAYHSYLKWRDAQAKAATMPAQTEAGNSYGSTAAFNANTGRFQSGEQSADRHSDHNKSKRQMDAFFDVDAAANAHEGRSLKADRQAQKYSKKEIAAMNEKRKAKKQEKRLAFLKS